jgi:hypothetical protein
MFGDRYMQQVGNGGLIPTSVSANTSIFLENVQGAARNEIFVMPRTDRGLDTSQIVCPHGAARITGREPPTSFDADLKRVGADDGIMIPRGCCAASPAEL